MLAFKSKKELVKTIIYIVSFSFLIACSNSEVKQSNTVEKNTTETKSAIKREAIEIKLSAEGESMAELAFEPKSISVPSNSTVILTFENKSSAVGMFHNFVLVELGSGQEISALGLKAGKAKQFTPKDKRVIAHTKVLDMGETITIEFDAPAKGSYHYICTYPGHTNMIGRFNVE